MILISLLLTWAAVQLWGSGAPLQRDNWFEAWCARLSSIKSESQRCGLIVALPVLAVWLLAQGLAQLSPLLLVLLNVPVLLYSLGRGDFNRQLLEYQRAWRRDDSVRCAEILAELEPAEEAHLQQVGNWPQLHIKALRIFAYRGFERMFAVIFWFLLLGAAGALLYRLIHLLSARSDGYSQIARWLWWLEWPAVRLVGLSWALVGNFVGCAVLWRKHFFAEELSSAELLLEAAQGALGLKNEPCADTVESSDNCAQLGCDGRQLQALKDLLGRTLLLWVSAVALFSMGLV